MTLNKVITDIIHPRSEDELMQMRKMFIECVAETYLELHSF
jgi:hypothetical protein